MSLESLYQKGNDQARSPPWLWDGILGDWFDPCPLNGNELRVFDGLGTWPDKTKVNPPYSDPLPWVKRAIEMHREGKRVVLLLKPDSSTEWWRLLFEAGAHFLAFMERLDFKPGKGAPFPSVLVILA